jgi:endonuclease YncB( thermonuclease family)
MRTIATVLASLALATPALADVTVTDGDSLVVNGSRIRLHGIDSPEAYQSCTDGWAAGAMATQTLRDLVRGRAVTCEPKATDRFGRTVAVCRADGVDLGAAMVRAGLDVAFEARAAKVGMHAHSGCMLPSEFRSQQRR